MGHGYPVGPTASKGWRCCAHEAFFMISFIWEPACRSISASKRPWERKGEAPHFHAKSDCCEKASCVRKVHIQLATITIRLHMRVVSDTNRCMQDGRIDRDRKSTRLNSSH